MFCAPLQGLQADRWGLLRSRSAVSFCTKTEDSTKPGRKKKAAEKSKALPLAASAGSVRVERHLCRCEGPALCRMSGCGLLQTFLLSEAE